jgi:hypothetical protein
VLGGGALTALLIRTVIEYARRLPRVKARLRLGAEWRSQFTPTRLLLCTDGIYRNIDVASVSRISTIGGCVFLTIGKRVRPFQLPIELFPKERIKQILEGLRV